MDSITSFKKEFEFLSNFYAASFVQGEFLWPTVEHAYQAAKTNSDYNRRKIRAAKTPAIAKKLGQNVTLREDWEQVKVSIMTELVWEKFEQNPKLKHMLLYTDPIELVEGNYWHDNFWGVCFCDKCWNQKGKNMLGYILMQVRDMLIPEMTKKQKLREAVSQYIEAKIKMTKCMQIKFKQLCPKCVMYDGCPIYKNYVNMWQNLQSEVN